MIKLKVVAEGLETVEHLRIVRQLGCDYGQGYYFSRPVDLPALRKLLQAWNAEALVALMQPSNPNGRFNPAA